MIRYIEGEQYFILKLDIKKRRDAILEHLKKIAMPTTNAKAYIGMDEISYSTFQRDIRSLAKANKINILIQKGGKHGCRTIIEGVSKNE